MTISSVTPISTQVPTQRQAGVGSESLSGQSPAPVREPSAASAPSAEMPREQLESVVANMQSAMQSIRRDINFQLDDSTGRVVVKVVDGSSGEVVRQIPSEEALELAARLEDMRSLLFREEA
ncbi:flagellar biosynthesis protein FlaG [Pseudomonas sp. phDV1]|nr:MULTISPECIES: flagellar protein FlaG [unclassified Pseudomonas]AXO62305.1 flagellar biosynthesis protein FlaG [Pseudomonas sp. phDV1]MDZ4190725.1 flagellar protein FlaG [Pseudomonas sp.]